MAKLPTVKIKLGDGFCIINESDYDPEKHEKYRAPKKGSKKPVKKAPPVDTIPPDELPDLPPVEMSVPGDASGPSRKKK